MKRRVRVQRGEPLEEQRRARAKIARPIDLGQVLSELEMLGHIGVALTQPPRPEPEPGVIEMEEIAPGVFARQTGPVRRAEPGPVQRLRRMHRQFAQLRREIQHARR